MKINKKHKYFQLALFFIALFIFIYLLIAEKFGKWVIGGGLLV